MQTRSIHAPLGAAALFAVLTLGCDGEAATHEDGGAADAGTSDVVVAAAALPSFDCAEGWSARPIHEAIEVDACEPWALGTDPRCPSGQARFPGEASCAPLGDACPADRWPADLPASGVVYVDADAAPGGDGSGPSSALDTIAAGLGAARAGDVVAVAKGEYVEAVRVPANVTLRGACAAETRVLSPSPSTTATIELGGVDVVVERLGVGGASRPGIGARGGAAGTVRDVEVAGAEGIGVWVTGGALTVTRLVVRDVEPIADGRFGQGVVVDAGGSLVGSDLALIDVTEDGLFVGDPGTTVDVTRLLAIGTTVRPADGLGGLAVRVIDGAAAVLRRAVIEGNTQGSVLAREAGSSLELEDSVVRATNPGPFVGEPALGRGVNATDEGRVTLRRVLLERHHDAALRATMGATIEAEDLAVVDTAPETFDDSDGFGVAVQSGATVRLTRAVIARSHTSGVQAEDPTTLFEATDLSVWSTAPRASDGAGGRGLAASFGAEIIATRVHVEDCAEIAVALTDGALATLTDLRVVDTVGRGLEVNRGSVLTLTNASLVGSQTAGLVASGADTRATLSGVSLIGGEVTLENRGRGLHVQNDAVVDGSRVRVLGNRELGMLAVGGGRVELEDVRIGDIRRRACANTTCPETGLGYGAVTFLGGHIALHSFEIERCALAGVVIGEGGTGMYSDGVIGGQPIGVNIRDEAVEFDDAFVDVAFADNERNVEAQSLPLPDAALEEG